MYDSIYFSFGQTAVNGRQKLTDSSPTLLFIQLKEKNMFLIPIPDLDS